MRGCMNGHHGMMQPHHVVVPSQWGISTAVPAIALRLQFSHRFQADESATCAQVRLLHQLHVTHHIHEILDLSKFEGKKSNI